MVKKLLLVIVTVFLFGISGCSLLDSGFGVGDVAEGDLDSGVDINQLIPEAEEILLSYGFVVENDWPALEYSLKSGEGLSVLVEGSRIDPVIVLLDKEGQILAVGDDWDEELDAFVSIDEVPSGSRVIVFDINGDDGTFDIEIDSLEKYEWELESDKEYESFILGEKENEEWDDLLQDVNELYKDSWETSRVFPLTVRGEKWVKIVIDSEIDCVMALVAVDGDDLLYIDYDDDTQDMNPVFSGMLESGDYLVVVDTYNGSDDAEFTISLTELDPDDMTIEIIEVDEMETWFSGEFRDGAFVMNYWPDVDGNGIGILGTELALVYEFEIDIAGEYVLDVESYDDTKMVVIDDNQNFIDYNDDGPEGLNPQLTLQLSPGAYSAIVVPYSESSSELVEFRYAIDAPIEREQGSAPFEDTFAMRSNEYYSLVFESGTTYEIFAESDEIDLTLFVEDGAGDTYYSDDDGGDLNPYLVIEATRANAGVWAIDLEAYSGDQAYGEVYFVARPLEENRSATSSAPIEIDL